MKLTKLVPCISKLRHDGVVVVLLRHVAIGASFGFGRAAAGGDGQAVKMRAGCGILSERPPRTVCGTLVLKAMPLIPSAEIVCC